MKKLLFICVVISFIAYSFFFPELTVNAARNGIQIWFSQILPALLPFTILSSVLVKSNFLKSFRGNANLIACLLTLSCGFIFGFPVGAKLSSDFYKQNLLSKKHATILSIATNNFSPMYVCGFAMPLLFGSKEYNQACYVLLYLVPLVLVCIYLLFDMSKEQSLNNATHSAFRMDMQVMDFGIINGFESLIKICGYIVLFSIVTELSIHTISNIVTHPPLVANLLLGNLEITNGIKGLSTCDINMQMKYISAIQLLSFGGLSGIAQTGSILSDAGLSMHKYIIGKALLSLLLTLLSVIYVFFIR
jgi:hypothetical protein